MFSFYSVILLFNADGRTRELGMDWELWSREEHVVRIKVVGWVEMGMGG